MKVLPNIMINYCNKKTASNDYNLMNTYKCISFKGAQSVISKAGKGEIKELINRIKLKDNANKADAKNKLILKYKSYIDKLVRKLVGEFKYDLAKIEELQNIVYATIPELAEKYPPKTRKSFKSYINLPLYRKICKEIKKLKSDSSHNSEAISLSKSNLCKNIPDETISNPLQVLLKKELLTILTECIEKLQPKEQQVLKQYYGLNGEKEVAFRLISKKLNITYERVRQIHNKSLAKLKKQLTEVSVQEELSCIVGKIDKQTGHSQKI